MQHRRSPIDLDRGHFLIIQSEEPLIGIPFTDASGNESWRLFTSEDDAEAFARTVRGDHPESLAGVWSDLDWDEMEQALDRIRHDSVPTPPIDDL